MHANRIPSLFFMALFGIQPATARDSEWSDADFAYYASRLRSSPQLHQPMIDGCTINALSAMDQPTKNELSAATNMTVDEAVHETCRRMIKGIATGKFTYNDYRKWLETGPGSMISIPDYTD